MYSRRDLSITYYYVVCESKRRAREFPPGRLPAVSYGVFCLRPLGREAAAVMGPIWKAMVPHGGARCILLLGKTKGNRDRIRYLLISPHARDTMEAIPVADGELLRSI